MPSAVAPYGADGSNGVILITTKTGTESRRDGKAHFSFDSSFGLQDYSISGPSNITSSDRVIAMSESIWNTYGNGEFGNGLLNSRDEIPNFLENTLGNRSLSRWYSDGQPDINWHKIVKNENALIADLNFSASQNNEVSHFYGSIGFNKTEGVTIGTGLQRLTGMLNYGQNFGDKFDFNVSAIVGNVRQKGISEEVPGILAQPNNPNYGRFTMPNWVLPYNEDGTLNVEDFHDITNRDNIRYTATHDFIRNYSTRAIQNTRLSYDILEDLKFTTVLGLDYNRIYYKNFSNFRTDGGNGSDTEISADLFHYTTQNSLDYNFKVGDLHKFNVTIVQEYGKSSDRYLQGTGKGFPNEHLKNLSAASNAKSSTGTFSDQAKMRYVGLLKYDLNRKYIVDLSYSYEGDSRFSRKFNSFYSAGASWNLSREDFINNVDFINDLSFRVGYGLTGNAGIGRNQYQRLINYQVYGSSAASMIQNFGTDATWEKSSRFDLGLSFSLFDRRLDGQMGFFNNETRDMLLEVPEPFTSGFKNGHSVQNRGEMLNRGFEVELGGYLVKSEDLNWRLDLNFSTLKNKVKSMPSPIIQDNQSTRSGRKVREWFLRDWAGIDPNNGEPLWYVDLTVNDETTNDYNKAKRRLQNTNPLPTYYGMVSTRLEFKNVFINAEFYYSGGNQVYDFKQNFLQATSGTNMTTHNPIQKAFDNSWFEPGDITDYPRWDYSNSKITDFTNDSTRWLYDDDFVRLRSVSIGYKFPSNWVKNLHVDELNFSIEGRNLWTWVKDSHFYFDPEVSNFGYVDATTPPIKTILFNLSIKF